MLKKETNKVNYLKWNGKGILCNWIFISEKVELYLSPFSFYSLFLETLGHRKGPRYVVRHYKEELGYIFKLAAKSKAGEWEWNISLGPACNSFVSPYLHLHNNNSPSLCKIHSFALPFSFLNKVLLYKIYLICT